MELARNLYLKYNWKIPKYLEIKQYTSKQHFGQRSHKGN